MKDALNWKLPKSPFLLVNALLLGLAGLIVWRAPHPISHMEAALCIVSVALGALVGTLPFVLEYRAFLKIVEVNALSSVVEQIQNLENIGAQISSSTDQWARIQEIVQTNADKTVAGAKEIAEHMAAEVREFNEFQQKMNDGEKAALRLETEKLRRGEGEWLQMVVRILDHIFALHNAAVRSGQPELAAQIGNFQNACRSVTRRVGLTAFEAEPDQPFDSKQHQVAGNEQPPDGALVAETVAAGFTIQGKLLRPALVRLKTSVAENPVAENAGAGELPLETPATE